MNPWLLTDDGQLVNLTHASRLRIWTKDHAGRTPVTALMPSGVTGEWVTVRSFDTISAAEDFLAAIADGEKI